MTEFKMVAERRKQRGEPVRIIIGRAEIITFRPRIVIDLLAYELDDGNGKGLQ
jgi:hypothetical protein